MLSDTTEVHSVLCCQIEVDWQTDVTRTFAEINICVQNVEREWRHCQKWTNVAMRRILQYRV